MLSDVATAEVNPSRRVLNREALVNRACMTTAIPNVQHDTRGQPTSVQTEHAGWVEEELGYLEVFEKHLGGADPIADWIVRRLRQEYWVFPGIHLEFFEDMSPDCFHIIPILNDAMIHGILKLEDALKFFL